MRSAAGAPLAPYLSNDALGPDYIGPLEAKLRHTYGHARGLVLDAKGLPSLKPGLKLAPAPSEGVLGRLAR